MNPKRLRWAAGALIFLSSVTAGLAAGTVELVSRANPHRLSDTASGAPEEGPLFPPPSLSSVRNSAYSKRLATPIQRTFKAGATALLPTNNSGMR